MRGLWAVFSPILPGYWAALILHTQARRDQAEARRAQPAESAFCTSFVLIFHTAIIKKRSFTVATWRSNSNKPTTSHSFHFSSGKSLPVRTDAMSTCPRCAVLFFSTYSTLLLLKRTNQLLQPECSPDGKRWLNIKPEEFPIQILKHKSTFKCCLQHSWHYTITFVKSVSAVRTVLRGNVEQSCPLLGICVQTCSSEVQPKPKTLAESHLRSPIQAQNRLNHFVRSEPILQLKIQLDTYQALKKKVISVSFL